MILFSACSQPGEADAMDVESLTAYPSSSSERVADCPESDVMLAMKLLWAVHPDSLIT